MNDMMQLVDIILILLLIFFAYNWGKEVGRGEALEKEIDEIEFKVFREKVKRLKSAANRCKQYWEERKNNHDRTE